MNSFWKYIILDFFLFRVWYYVFMELFFVFNYIFIEEDLGFDYVGKMKFFVI